MARYRDEISSPQESDASVPATSTDYYVVMDGEASCDPADLNASDKALEHIVLRTKLTEVQQACRCVDVPVFSSRLLS